MQSRTLHALLACAVLLAAAEVYGLLAGVAVDRWRVMLWGGVGVCAYILLSRVFGFDPERGGVARFASPLMAYVARWELRSGQATLGMVGCVALGALLVDADNFLIALVCGTLAAWIYFAVRLVTGGYEPPVS